MHWLSTVLSALLALLSTAMAVWAQRACAMCHEQAMRLNTSRGRIVALEAAIEGLDTRLRKLSGQFHATKHVPEEMPGPRQLVETPVGPICENWARACDEGPSSTAAACQCDYCERQRFERRQLRMDLVPKTAAAQGNLAKLNSGQ